MISHELLQYKLENDFVVAKNDTIAQFWNLLLAEVGFIHYNYIM